MIEKKDYEEPRCPMDNSMWVRKVKSIPVDRVISKEDEYLSMNDYAAAERHLLYWWSEAENGNDERGKLVLCNELMGLHRKLGNKEKAVDYSLRAVSLVSELGLEDTISGATAFLNSGTVYKAFGEPEKSLEYFEKAKRVYEKESRIDDERLSGLYNNMALTLVDLERFSDARALYDKAVNIVKKSSKTSEAITLLNIADCIVLEKGAEASENEVHEYLDRADSLLDAVPESERNGDYAFVCEKCAPVFDYYGYFMSADKFKGRAEEIYRAYRK